MNVELLLRRLGGVGTLKGFRYTVYMIEQVIRDPNMVLFVYQKLYLDAAEHFHVSADAVEHAVRTVIRSCWERGDLALMEAVAGRKLSCRPTNGEFLDMIAAYLRQQRGG